MNPDFKEFVLFVFVFTSVELAAVALGQFASCISANILVGLAAREDPPSSHPSHTSPPRPD